METIKRTKIESGFGSDRKPIKARCWNGVGLSSWKEMEVSQCEDEGKNIISIGRVPKEDFAELKNDAELFFLLEDIPSLIATLTKVAEDTQKAEFKNQVSWELSEANKFNK
mgnify:CR=1 FL=1|tara:strand:- start:2098 stop:2430 length:333 start_codon:yes stop_codon:yes gene_type:complete